MSKLPPVDWSRYAAGVHSRAQDSTGKTHTPLGDPLKWGGEQTIQVVNAAGFGFFDTPQFLRAQVDGVYPRAWSCTGVVHLPNATWALGDAAAGGFDLVLELIQGVGQASVQQEFDLRKLTTRDTVGAASFYDPVFTNGNFGAREGRAFSMVGVVIGQRWDGRVRIVVGGAHNFFLTAQIMLTPLAAGQGL